MSREESECFKKVALGKTVRGFRKWRCAWGCRLHARRLCSKKVARSERVGGGGRLGGIRLLRSQRGLRRGAARPSAFWSLPRTSHFRFSYSVVAPTPFTLHHALFTLHPSPLPPTPCTMHHTPCTLHPTPCSLHPTPYTLHHTPYTLHPTPYTLHPAPSNRDPCPCIAFSRCR